MSKWKVIGRGKVGWYAEGVNEQGHRTSSSGGDLNPYTYWTGVECLGYRQEAEEGALVYDAQDADFEAFSTLIISGPMKDVTLGDWEYSHLMGGKGEISVDVRDSLTLEMLDVGYGVRGLGSIGLGIYEHLLRQVGGVRFGKVKNGEVIWE